MKPDPDSNGGFHGENANSPGRDGVQATGHMKPTLFVHIPKTAGTSFVSAAREVVGPSAVLGWNKKLTPETDALLLTAHLPYSYWEDFMPGRFTFTILRDPVERLWSWCRYKETHVRRDPEGAAEKVLFSDETRGSARRTLWNRMTRQLGGDIYEQPDEPPLEDQLNLALERLDYFDRVYFTESFDDSQRELFEAVGLPYDGPHRRQISKELPMTDSIRERCEELSEYDRILYDKALAKFG